MAKKKPKDVQPSGAFGPIFLGVVFALLGAGIGFYQLTRKSAEKNPFFVSVSVQEYLAEGVEPKGGEDKVMEETLFKRRPDYVKYIKGSTSGGRNWKAKREALMAGSPSVSVSVAELNTWLRSNFRVSSDDASGLFSIVPSTPQLAATEGTLHVYMPITIQYVGGKLETIAIAQGVLETANGGIRFAPKKAYLGSSPLPAGIAGVVQGLLMKAFKTSEEYEAIRDTLTTVIGVQVQNGGVTFKR